MIITNTLIDCPECLCEDMMILPNEDISINEYNVQCMDCKTQYIVSFEKE